MISFKLAISEIVFEEFIGGMINNGTIIADKATQLTIDTDTEGFVQAGILRATGTGGLLIANTPTFTNKILDSAVSSLRGLGNQLPSSLVDEVVDHLVSARHIFFFGLGVSNAVAQDAQHHFFRFELPVSAHADVLMQRMHAAAADPTDLFFLISHTGRTRDLVDIATLARDRGAKVIALTAKNSPLAKASDLAIELEVMEDTDAYMPMTSRLVHLAVLDVLAAGVTLRRGESLQTHLRAIKESLRATRYAPIREENRA